MSTPILRSTWVAWFIVPWLGLNRVYAQNSQLVVKNGTTLTVTSGHLVLNNTDLHCDGGLNAAGATLWITGAHNTQFAGSGLPKAGVLNLNSSSASTLSLNTDLQVTSALNFQNGIIDLNGHELQLTGSGVLQSESETSHITGLTGGDVTAAATGINNPSQLNIGHLGAILTSSANLGSVSVTRWQKPAVNPGNTSMEGIQRTYLIQPANNSSINATLRFSYLDEELNGKNPSTLTLWKSEDGINWMLVGADTRNAAGKYVEKTGLTDLSYWTLSDVINPLPLTLLFFRVECQNNYAQIQWQTGAESGLDKFVVESSNDGINWTSLGTVPALNAASGSAYKYKDASSSSSTFYRLRIIDQSGTFSFSPVFRGGCSELAMPFTVYPNPAEAQAVAQLSVRQAMKTNVLILDMGGRIVYGSSWNLQPGINQFILPVATLAAGTYIVRLILSNTTVQTKLIKK